MGIRDIFSRIVGDNRNSYSNSTDRLAIVAELSEQFIQLDPAKRPVVKSVSLDWKPDGKDDFLPTLVIEFYPPHAENV